VLRVINAHRRVMKILEVTGLLEAPSTGLHALDLERLEVGPGRRTTPMAYPAR
jgi:hypothetical protein